MFGECLKQKTRLGVVFGACNLVHHSREIRDPLLRHMPCHRSQQVPVEYVVCLPGKFKITNDVHSMTSTKLVQKTCSEKNESRRSAHWQSPHNQTWATQNHHMEDPMTFTSHTNCLRRGKSKICVASLDRTCPDLPCWGGSHMSYAALVWNSHCGSCVRKTHNVHLTLHNQPWLEWWPVNAKLEHSPCVSRQPKELKHVKLVHVLIDFSRFLQNISKLQRVHAYVKLHILYKYSNPYLSIALW